MTQDSLIEIGSGDEARASILNGNFIYLDGQITAQVNAAKSELRTNDIAGLTSSVETLQNNTGNGGLVPAGTIIMWGGDTTPSGYLPCNGTAGENHDGYVSKTTYQSLFNAIGYKYDTNQSGDLFALPNFRNRFPKGSGDLAVGTYGNPIVGNHTHKFTQNYAYGTTTSNVTYYPMPMGTAMTGVGNANYDTAWDTWGVTGYAGGSNEPYNLVVLYCIKY